MAADDLGITKSAVSQQVRLLEAELGVQLINRTTRGSSLTALGERLVVRCQLLQDQVDLVFADIVSAGIQPKGRFAVTYPHALESCVVMPALEHLCIEYPGLEPELAASDTVLDLIADKLDVAIYVGELPDSSYRALPVGTITEIFCASPLYLNRTSTPISPESLREHRWIATRWQQAKMPIFQLGDNTRLIVTLKRFAQVSTLPSAVDMALRHMGIVLLPDVVAIPLFKTGELVHIAGGFTGPHWPVHMLHAYQGEKPVHISRFHQLVRRFFMGTRAVP